MTRVWGHDVRQQLFILKKCFAAEDNAYFGAENQIAGEKIFWLSVTIFTDFKTANYNI
jgi:hypothetical protein